MSNPPAPESNTPRDAPRGVHVRTVYVLLVKEGEQWRVDDVTHVEVASCESD